MRLQKVEIVLTAHPTQVMRRSLQFKQARVGALLQEHENAIAMNAKRDDIQKALMREIMSMWQTDELRRNKPTPQEEAKGGLHILEQSLWNAVPAYIRELNEAVLQVRAASVATRGMPGPEITLARQPAQHWRTMFQLRRDQHILVHL